MREGKEIFKRHPYDAWPLINWTGVVTMLRWNVKAGRVSSLLYLRKVKVLIPVGRLQNKEKSVTFTVLTSSSSPGQLLVEGVRRAVGVRDGVLAGEDWSQRVTVRSSSWSTGGLLMIQQRHHSQIWHTWLLIIEVRITCSFICVFSWWRQLKCWKCSDWSFSYMRDVSVHFHDKRTGQSSAVWWIIKGVVFVVVEHVLNTFFSHKTLESEKWNEKSSPFADLQPQSSAGLAHCYASLPQTVDD